MCSAASIQDNWHAYDTMEGGMLFDILEGEVFILNETGLFIVQCLRSGKSISEIANALARKFSVQGKRARKDAIAFIDQLNKLGIATTKDE